MPSYADRNRSLLYALSDFWTQIFADSDTVESMYRGAEILVGQIYLDLLGDMLNMSVRDAALFRKELFRLIRVREDVVLRAPDGRYRVPLGADIHRIETLNNKVFAVTSALERGTDFVQIDADGNEGLGATGLFRADPTAAQPVLTVGTGASALRFTGVIPGAPLLLELVDDGASPPTSALTFDPVYGAQLTVHFDGAGSGGTGIARVVADALTADPVARERVLVEVLAPQGVLTTPPPVLMPTALSFAHGMPVSGFGARVFPVTFGTKFTAPRTLQFGAQIGVEKGDILRLEPSSRSGGLCEVPVALVRDAALYSHFAAVPVGSEPAVLSRRDYSILRTPSDYKVEAEAWMIDTLVADTGDVDRATATLKVTGLGADDAWLLLTDTVFLAGALNAGPITLVSWDAGTETFSFFGASLEDEVGVPILRQNSLYRTDDSGGSYSLDPVTGEADQYDLTGFLATDAMVGGVVFITDDYSIPGVKGRVLSVTGGVARLVDLQLDEYTPTGPLLAIAVVHPQTLETGFVTRLALDRPAYDPGASPELRTQLFEGSLSVKGRRLLDGRALQKDVDWTYVSSLSGVRWVNTPSLQAGVTFDYEIRRVVYASSDLATTVFTDGQLAYVSPTDLRVKLTRATPITNTWTLGDRIELSAGTGAPNSGTYYVEEILPDNAVVLGGGHTPVLPEPLDGALGVTTWPTGTVDVDAPQERIVEVAMWAPDIQVDRMSLASTYGYLLDRVEPSSEAYRSTLRGLMQLYMLGPTCARLEAAVHVLAGLPVVRDENELLLSYERDVVASGSGLSLDGPTRTARLSSGEFPASVEGFLVVQTGFNERRVFTVESKISPSELLLTAEPFTESGVDWEIVGDDVHAIVTDKNRYPLPLTLPFKERLTTPSNFGVLRLRAFSTFTEAVQVQDEVGTPGWWQDARIPAALWPGQGAARLQSSPAYVEHVVDPVDDAHIGDPGFCIGTDDSGEEITRAVLHAETVDGTGTLRMDPHAPFSYENATFTSTVWTTSVDDVGYVIRTWLPSGDELELQILGIVDTNTWRVGLPMTLPGGLALCPAWELVVDTAVLRHNTAFIVFDRYLKQHVFSVEIDAGLLGTVDARLLSEIQTRLREVRPAHTYLALSPSTVLTDVLDLSDEMLRQRQIDTSGAGGDAIAAAPNELRIDGTWRIGDFFRYVDWTRTDDLTDPPVPIADSPPGYFTDIHDIEWVSGVTVEFQPAPLYNDPGAENTLGTWFVGTADLEDADVSGGVWITFADPLPAEVTASNVLLCTVKFEGPSVFGQRHRIGRVDAENNRIRVYVPGLTAQTGQTVRIQKGVVFSATVERQDDGSTTLTAPAGSLPSGQWSPDDMVYTLVPMTAVGLDGTGVASGLVDPAAPWQLGAQRSAGVWDIGFVDSRFRTSPAQDADIVIDSGDILLVLPEDTPLDQQFTPELGYDNRAVVDPTMAGAVKVGVQFGGVVNANKYAVITEVRTPFVAVLSEMGWTLNEAPSPFGIWRQHAATLPAEPVTLPVRCVIDPQRWVLGLPTFDDAGVLGWADSPATVSDLVTPYVDETEITFHAYGRMSPVDLDATPAEPENGDTPFLIGGLSPSLRAVRRRTQTDFDLTELPLEITRTAVTPDPELLYMNGEPVQMNGEDTYVII